MDLLIHGLKGIAVFGQVLREKNIRSTEADVFLMEGLFTTVTNVNFDPRRLEGTVRRSYEIRKNLEKFLKPDDAQKLARRFPAAGWIPADTYEGLLAQGKKVGILANPALNEDIRSLQEILLYGMKGMAAYADHAYILGSTDEEVNSFFYKGLAALADETPEASTLTNLIAEFGLVNLKALETLDVAHNNHFGAPTPGKVSLGARKGPAIAISGHDLLDLEMLLQQTDGTGINIYTHGEMLPAHGYPELKKYPHLAGHYGTAWQNQQKEFDSFPGAILMTTNCIQKPRDTYRDRIFTTGLVAWPGVTHIDATAGTKNFKKVIDRALSLPGFSQDIPGKEILVGFGHNAVLSVADKVIAAVKSGAVKHFFLIGGCDGAKPGRNYYTEFAEKVPGDCVILTLACGKFRFNTLEFGDIGGIPRLLDCGQCNDAYSAIVIARALAKAFNCGINELPLSLILSWYEQKAVCILLTLFSLGVKNIRLGPSLPAFVSPNVLKVLVENFGIKPITTPDEDLAAILGHK
jgi:hydroxylamine reductase